MKQPPQAPLFTFTIASPFLCLSTSLVYDRSRFFSIFFERFNFSLLSFTSSPLLSLRIVSNSDFFSFRSSFFSLIFFFVTFSISFVDSIFSSFSRIFFLKIFKSNSLTSISFDIASYSRLFLTFNCWSLYFLISFFASDILFLKSSMS